MKYVTKSMFPAALHTPPGRAILDADLIYVLEGYQA